MMNGIYLVNNAINSALRYTGLRFAHRRIKQYKRYAEISDMALWRKARGMDTNHNTFGPLTNLPDYSFVDGRPVPLSRNLERRLEKQREYAESIVRLSGEIDWAREHYHRRVEEESSEKQKIIGSKLKQKGESLLRKNKHKS